MKLAICKIGANITFSSQNASAACADILYFLRTLDPSQHKVTICTHKTRNTIIPRPLIFQEIQMTNNFNEYDAVIVFNGSINFFGGAEDLNLIRLYKALSKTKVPIAYANTDGQLPFQQLWPLIHKRDWAKKYHYDEFEIDGGNVSYITQGKDLKKVRAKTNEKPHYVSPSTIIYFPLDMTILAKNQKFFKDAPPIEDRPFELIFGGATRNTYKRKRIEHYYNDSRISTLLFGNLRGVHCPNAKFEGKVSYQQFVRMMYRGKSTIIIGDEFYENNFCTLRVWESVLAGCNVFIDNRFDSHNTIFSEHSDMYITRPYEIMEETPSHIESQKEIYRSVREFNYIPLQKILTDIIGSLW